MTLKSLSKVKFYNLNDCAGFQSNLFNFVIGVQTMEPMKNNMSKYLTVKYISRKNQCYF